MDEQVRAFHENWRSLASSFGLGEETSTSVGTYLLRQYSGLGRHYHDLRHINSMLRGADRLEAAFRDANPARLAIFFHDAIYDPARRDNEERSAKAMREMLAGRVDATVLDRAAAMVEATKAHQAGPDNDTDLVLDLDMAILGQPWETYRTYARNVMREYVSVYGEAAYRKGRVAAFLEPMIARGSVFLTPEFRSLDAQALLNMRKERDILNDGSDMLA